MLKQFLDIIESAASGLSTSPPVFGPHLRYRNCNRRSTAASVGA